MEAGAISETIEVKASAPLLESNTSSLGQVIETKAVSDLPLNGRNFAQLAILGPGVVGRWLRGDRQPSEVEPGRMICGPARSSFRMATASSRTTSCSTASITIFRRNGLITLRPSVEAVREFKIQTNLFQAEQGRNPGATINVITKSGSNAFHGSVYEFFRNTQLDAKNFFAKPGSNKAQYQQNQFGASLGGPIRHDKLFLLRGL